MRGCGVKLVTSKCKMNYYNEADRVKGEMASNPYYGVANRLHDPVWIIVGEMWTIMRESIHHD